MVKLGHNRKMRIYMKAIIIFLIINISSALAQESFQVQQTKMEQKKIDTILYLSKRKHMELLKKQAILFRKHDQKKARRGINVSRNVSSKKSVSKQISEKIR